ncbi:hypothetical protein FOZ61_001390 [Perkinsus olseni]|uniref:Uncharacterized protein n=1 Tax=Perkinsus olseni TaxID=32597 RepID=A0A7J6LWT3_PEROL|nr:hypothetical protein FOZ61_001390 [Perkinsus olseni]KAF4667099.1 hypothetical protein FOL46_002685 [Perkinsus olseni]
MTTTIFLIALASGVVGSIFDGYTLPGDEQYWRLRGDSTVPVPTSTTSTTATPATSTESALDQLLSSLVIPEYRHVPTTAEPLSIEEQLRRLEIPYYGIPTAAPSTTTPAPPATTSKLAIQQLLEMTIPLEEGFSPTTAVETSAPPPPPPPAGNLRGGELTSYSEAVAPVSWCAVVAMMVTLA